MGNGKTLKTSNLLSFYGEIHVMETLFLILHVNGYVVPGHVTRACQKKLPSYDWMNEEETEYLLQVIRVNDITLILNSKPA